MKTIPTEIKAEGTKIYARLGGLNMPLSEEIIKKHCGHQPKSEMEAKVMAIRLKGKMLDFPNINPRKQKRKIKTWSGNRDNPEYRKERIERRKRRERNIMKVNVGVKLDSEVVKSELFQKLLEIDGVKRVKKISDSSIELETERKLENKTIGQKEVNEKIIKTLEGIEEIKEIISIDYQD